MDNSGDDTKRVINEVIQKQKVILGPDIAILKARNVSGLKLSNDGDVEGITGNPREVLKELIDEYVSLSGLIVRKAMEPLLRNYPDLALDTAQSSVKNGGGS